MDIWFKQYNIEDPNADLSRDAQFNDSYNETILNNSDAIFPISLTKPTFHSGVHFHSIYGENRPIYNSIPGGTIVCRGFEEHVSELDDCSGPVFSSSFLILRHTIHADEDYVFYTMYTNLLPFTYYGFKVNGDYKDVIDDKDLKNATFPSELPFYLKLKVKVKEGIKNPSWGNKGFLHSRIQIKSTKFLLSGSKHETVTAISCNSNQEISIDLKACKDLEIQSIKIKDNAILYNYAGYPFAKYKNDKNGVYYYPNVRKGRIGIKVKGAQLKEYERKGIVYFNEEMRKKNQFRYGQSRNGDIKTIIAAVNENEPAIANNFLNHFYPLQVLTKENDYFDYSRYFSSENVFCITNEQFKKILKEKKHTIYFNDKNYYEIRYLFDKKEKEIVKSILNITPYTLDINFKELCKYLKLEKSENIKQEFVCFYNYKELYSFEQGEEKEYKYVILPNKKDSAKFFGLEKDDLKIAYKIFSIYCKNSLASVNSNFTLLQNNYKYFEEIDYKNNTNKIKIRLLDENQKKSFKCMDLQKYDVGEFYVSNDTEVTMYVDENNIEEVTYTATIGYNNNKNYENGLLVYDCNDIPVNIINVGDSFYPKDENTFFNAYKRIENDELDSSKEEIFFKNNSYYVILRKQLNLTFELEEDEKLPLSTNSVIGHAFCETEAYGNDGYVDISLFTKKDVTEITYSKDYLPAGTDIFKIAPKNVKPISIYLPNKSMYLLSKVILDGEELYELKPSILRVFIDKKYSVSGIGSYKGFPFKYDDGKNELDLYLGYICFHIIDGIVSIKSFRDRDSGKIYTEDELKYVKSIIEELFKQKNKDTNVTVHPYTSDPNQYIIEIDCKGFEFDKSNKLYKRFDKTKTTDDKTTDDIENIVCRNNSKILQIPTGNLKEDLNYEVTKLHVDNKEYKVLSEGIEIEVNKIRYKSVSLDGIKENCYILSNIKFEKKDSLHWDEYKTLESKNGLYLSKNDVKELSKEKYTRYYDLKTCLTSPGDSDREDILENLKYLRCIHPMEWDVNTLSEKCEDGLTLEQKLKYQLRNLEETKKILKEQNFYEQFKKSSKDNITENSFAFYHPLPFLKKLDDANLLFMNPYFGKKYSEVYKPNDPDLKSKNVDSEQKIYFNPGFAPYSQSKGDESLQYYTKVTGFYNHDYAKEPNLQSSYGEYEHYYHEGVDFSGGEDCEIRSLIRAKVIAYGWQKNGNNYSTYGKVVWLYNLDGAGVYLLAHVKGFASNIEVGKVYYPGDVVAYIGRSGANKDGTKNETRWDAHLHLSFYNYQFKENADSLVKINGEDCSYTESDFLKFLNNPFKHNDKERMTYIRKTK